LDFTTRYLVGPNPKSTPPYPGSTVDLRLEPLIWVKNGLRMIRLFGGRPTFCPAMTQERKPSKQSKTVPNQKINHAVAVDLGRTLLSIVPQYLTQHATRRRFTCLPQTQKC
jgi:hypothetical protein